MTLKAVEDVTKDEPELPEKLKGLPNALVNALSISYKKGARAELPNALTKKLEPILKEGPLGLDDIMIDMYNHHEEIITNRNSFSTKLANLAKSGHLASHGRGIYGLPVKEGES